MSAQRSLLAEIETGLTRVTLEKTARASLGSASPSLDDVLSVWPEGLRHRLVLWVILGPGPEVAVAARFREHALDGASRELSRSLRRVQDDVPVVVEHQDGHTLVLAYQALVRSA